MTKKVQWSYTPYPVLWVLSGLWLVGWASRGSLAVTGSQVTDALLTRFSMFAVHSLITRGIVSQWGHRQRAWRRGIIGYLAYCIHQCARSYLHDQVMKPFFGTFLLRCNFFASFWCPLTRKGFPKWIFLWHKSEACQDLKGHQRSGA